MVTLGGNFMLVNVAEVLLLRYWITKSREVCKIGKIHENITEVPKSHVVQKIWWDITKMCHCVECSWKSMTRIKEKPLIFCEDRTYRFRNCRIGFTCLWVLFMFLLVLYFRLLHDIGKSASLFSSISLWSLWVFLHSTDFLAQFSHEKMSCSHSTRTWLNVKNHPPVRDHYQGDQNYHVSHLHLLIYGLA